MKYRSKFATADMDLLFETILNLETIDDCHRFFEDLCTINELIDLSQRMRVAQMLNDKISYQQITQETKASTATISRVNKALLYGAEGYQKALDKIKQKK